MNNRRVEKGFIFNRTLGGGGDNCNSCGDAPAGAQAGAGTGASDGMYK